MLYDTCSNFKYSVMKSGGDFFRFFTELSVMMKVKFVRFGKINVEPKIQEKVIINITFHFLMFEKAVLHEVCCNDYFGCGISARVTLLNVTCTVRPDFGVI